MRRFLTLAAAALSLACAPQARAAATIVTTCGQVVAGAAALAADL